MRLHDHSSENPRQPWTNASNGKISDEKILQALDELRANVAKQGGRLEALQDDVTAVKAETGKIPGLEQRLDHQGKLLTGLTATTATVLEEQHAQRSDIRTLHTEVHETREELKGEIRAARAEAKRDNMDLKATVVKRFQSDERRITNIEEHEGIENPEKH
jgi:chromosome segregation ATPase